MFLSTSNPVNNPREKASTSEDSCDTTSDIITSNNKIRNKTTKLHHNKKFERDKFFGIFL
jgi:hypothetical protein